MARPHHLATHILAHTPTHTSERKHPYAAATCVLLQASSAYKHSLKEVLALPAIASKIKDTKAAREVSALQDFYAMLTADSSRAFYGPGHVLAAAELGAIQTLLISGVLPTVACVVFVVCCVLVGVLC